MDGNCIRCGQVATLQPLAHLELEVLAAATERNAHIPHGATSLTIGLCEACTWAVAGQWPSAVGMCATIRHIERRAREDRRTSYAARTGGRRVTDQVVNLVHRIDAPDVARGPFIAALGGAPAGESR